MYNYLYNVQENIEKVKLFVLFPVSPEVMDNIMELLLILLFHLFSLLP